MVCSGQIRQYDWQNFDLRHRPGWIDSLANKASDFVSWKRDGVGSTTGYKWPPFGVNTHSDAMVCLNISCPRPSPQFFGCELFQMRDNAAAGIVAESVNLK